MLQEELSYQSSFSRSASGSIQASDEEALSPTGKASSAGSDQATPRSLRPGTVPRLNLSPAVALHAAALDNPSDDEDELLAPRDTQAPAAVPSFDDLSGPEDVDSEQEGPEDSGSDSEAVEQLGRNVHWQEAGMTHHCCSSQLSACVSLDHSAALHDAFTVHLDLDDGLQLLSGRRLWQWLCT